MSPLDEVLDMSDIWMHPDTSIGDLGTTLGLDSSISTKSDSDYPSGCYKSSGSSVYFNTYNGNPCSSSYPCLCFKDCSTYISEEDCPQDRCAYLGDVLVGYDAIFVRPHWPPSCSTPIASRM